MSYDELVNTLAASSNTEQVKDTLTRFMREVPPGLVSPDLKAESYDDDPGDGFYLLSYGLFAGFWVNREEVEVIECVNKQDANDHRVCVVLPEDLEGFLAANPDWMVNDEWDEE